MAPGRQGEPPQGNPLAMMNSREVDQIVHAYLVESGYIHTSFSLLHESSLAELAASSQPNSRKLLLDSISDETVPPGHLVRILQKGLLYLEAEARYRGDAPEPAPRLVGYPIPNALPLPPLPKYRPSTSDSAPPTPGPSNGPDTAVKAAGPSTTQGLTSKDKGKGKEKEKEATSGKRKGRAGSDREEQLGSDGKRPRTASGDKKKRVNGLVAAAAAAGNGEGEDSSVDMSLDDSPAADIEGAAPAPPPPIVVNAKAVGKTKPSRSASPAVPRSISPTTARATKAASSTSTSTSGPPIASNLTTTPSAASTTSALASLSLPQSNRPSALSNKASGPSSIDLPSTKERRPSLTGEPKKQEEILRIKAEEGEARSLASAKLAANEDVEMKGVVDMSRVLQVGVEDSSVVRLRGHTMPKVQPCSWNPKVPALLATGGGDSTCRIWDVPTPGKHADGKEGQVVKDNIVCKHSSAQRRADVAAVAWDPSGSLLATGSEDGIARIWTPSGDLHLVLSMHQRTIFSLKWNSAGTMLLTGSLDNSVCLWELSSGKVRQQWQTHTDSVLDVDWNDDATFASGSMDKSIHLFNISRVSPVHRFKGHRDEVNVVKFSPCGTLLASCSDDHTVRIWSLNNIPGLQLGNKVTAREEGRAIDDEDHAGVFVLEGHTSDVHTLAWAPWKKDQAGPRLLASASFDTTAKLWDADTGACLHTFARHSDFVYSIAFSPGDGALLATGSNDSKMCVWSVKDRKLLLEFQHAGQVYELAWHPSGGRIAVCGRTEVVAVVAVETGAGA